MYGFLSLAATVLSVAVVSAEPIIEERGMVSTPLLDFVQPTQACVGGAHIIIARASDESQGEGIIGNVGDMVKKMIPNSDSVAVVYPATIESYPTSEQEGVVGMKKLVTDYVNKCQGHKIVLMGYSQGAQVVADTLVGSNEKGFSDDSTMNTGLGTNLLSAISAIIMMGDPGNVPGAPGHVGNASKPGLFPRQNNDAFSQYGLVDKMQSYCDANDTFCSGGSSLSVHIGYTNEYGSQAAEFVAKQFGSSGSTGGSSGGSGSSVQPSVGGGGAATSKPASSAPASSVAASSPAKTSAALGGASTSKPASSAMSAAPNPASIQALLTTDRYFPTTTMHSGTFTELGAPIVTGAAAAVERGMAGVAAGAAIFAMGMM